MGYVKEQNVSSQAQAQHLPKTPCVRYALILVFAMLI
jgi:hypothetical protein